MKLADLHYHARRSLVLAERAKNWRQRIAEREAALWTINNALKGLPFEKHGYGVGSPGDWSRLYSGLSFGYYRDFGWRAAFLGGGE